MLFSTLFFAALASAPFDIQALDALPAKGRETFAQVAGEEFCGCDSALTLQGCLSTRPSCQLATHRSYRRRRAGGPVSGWRGGPARDAVW